MVQSEHNPGIIDFQDAVAGAVTYDLVSLLKDCYVAWPATRVRAWALGFRERLLRLGFAPLPDEREFLHWFDWVGLQRHIKVLGIFCRLHYRDAKPRYLNDLPRILASCLYLHRHRRGRSLERRERRRDAGRVRASAGGDDPGRGPR
jgi:aminoglycoside/choline kinase family phosphotransferase